MDKRYVIRFSGLFEHGFLKYSWWKQSQAVPLEPGKELEFATKFRFKWIANLCCRSMQNISDHRHDFRTWSVMEISIDQMKVDNFNNTYVDEN